MAVAMSESVPCVSCGEYMPDDTAVDVVLDPRDPPRTNLHCVECAASIVAYPTYLLALHYRQRRLRRGEG